MPKPYTPNDHWSRRAAEEGYRARSVYKLQELDRRLHLLRPRMRVLDLGAAPGSWLQYAAERVGQEGEVLGIDRTPIREIAPRVRTFQADIADLEGVRSALSSVQVEEVDLVLSDAAPSTSGVHDVDQWRSVELGRAVLAIAERLLRPGGKCLVKIFRGADFDGFLGDARRRFRDVRVLRTKATRDRSREVYVVMEKEKQGTQKGQG